MAGDLTWLWSLLGVVALFALGWLAFRLRHGRPSGPGKDSPEQKVRRVQRRGNTPRWPR